MTQSATKKLEAALKDLGLNKTAFNKCQKSYDNLKSDKVVKQTREDWRVIGTFISTGKENLKANKSNPNSGALNEFVSTYFPRLTSQEISNAQWLANNWEAVDKFAKENKIIAAFPDALKRAISKKLKDMNTTEEDWKSLGFKAKPSSSGTRAKSNKKDENKNPGLKDGDTKLLKEVKSLDNQELLDWLEYLTRELTFRSEAKEKALGFSSDQIIRIEKISVDMGNAQVEIQTKQGKYNKAA